MPLIDVDSLTREFTVTERESGLGGALRSVARRHTRSVTAVRDVSFSVESGTILGLLGPNGSGKTTTLKCVAGLLTPTAGSVSVLGLTPSERPPELLRRLGFVVVTAVAHLGDVEAVEPGAAELRRGHGLSRGAVAPQRKRHAPVDPRTTSSGRNTYSVRDAGIPAISSTSAWTVVSPMARTRCRTVVSGGSVKAMRVESS